MQDTTYNLVSVIIYAVSALAALLMLAIALWQLGRLAQQAEAAVKSNQLGQLNALLSLEQQISERRLELGSAGIALSGLDSADEEAFDAAKLRYDEAEQMYLNGLDRLCFCILKDFLPEEDMRVEYRGFINDSVKDFKGKLGVDTCYRNILKVYEKWADN